LLRNGDILPEKIRFYIGYSGWSEGQLHEELKEKTWLTAAAKSKLIFHNDVNEIWKDAIRLLGSDFEPIINYPIDPQLN
jgi:putative transcriptional regulator